MTNKSNHLIELIQTKHPHIFDVKLNLNWKSVCIGRLDESNGGVFVTKRNVNHLFRKYNSFGINAELLSSAIPFEKIVLSIMARSITQLENIFLKKAYKGFLQKKDLNCNIMSPLTN